ALRSLAPRVFLIAAVTGGTGGGMLVDTPHAAPPGPVEVRLATPGLWAVLIPAGAPHRGGPAPAPGHAPAPPPAGPARVRLSAPPELGRAPAGPGTPPFTDCYLLRQTSEAPGALADRLAEYLFQSSVLAGGPLDQLRFASRTPGSKVAVRAFGLAGLRFDRT